MNQRIKKENEMFLVLENELVDDIEELLSKPESDFTHLKKQRTIKKFQMVFLNHYVVVIEVVMNRNGAFVIPKLYNPDGKLVLSLQKQKDLIDIFKLYDENNKEYIVNVVKRVDKIDDFGLLENSTSIYKRINPNIKLITFDGCYKGLNENSEDFLHHTKETLHLLDQSCKGLDLDRFAVEKIIKKDDGWYAKILIDSPNTHQLIKIAY